MNVIRLFLISALASIITGQVLRFSQTAIYGAFTLTDVLVFWVDILFLFFFLLEKKPIKLPAKTFFPAVVFFLSAAASTVLAANFFSISQVITSSFFLFRFVAYFFVSVVVYNLIKKNQINNWINYLLFLGVIFSLIGFLQLLIVPDLSFLTPYGWDPHRNRIVSSFLDPNFAGLAFVIFLSFSLPLYLYTKKNIYLAISVLLTIASVLTYSRSSYLALGTLMLVVGFAKAPKIIVLTILLFIALIITNVQARERIVGAITFDETAKARVESWQKALIIFKDNILFGTGFNTYRFAQSEYGNFTYDNPSGGHSGAGSDSSLLLVAATTGLFGLSFFAILLVSILVLTSHALKRSYLSLASFSSMLAILVHSQFVNSFFFPQIMLIIWFLIGLNHVQNN